MTTGSQEVARYIRDQIELLRPLVYDHDGEGALPLREDARVFAESKLFSGLDKGLDLSRVNTKRVEVSKLPDGTLEVTLDGRFADVVIHVPCRGIVNYFVEFKDKEASGTFDGRIVATADDDYADDVFRDLQLALESMTTDPLDEGPPTGPPPKRLRWNGEGRPSREWLRYYGPRK